MARVYSSFKAAILRWGLGSGPPANAAFGVCAIDGTYVYDDSHSVAADLGASVVLNGIPLAGVAVNSTSFDADDAVFTGVTSTATIVGLVIYVLWDTGSQLVAFIDLTSDGTLPKALAADTLGIHWDSQGIFKL